MQYKNKYILALYIMFSASMVFAGVESESDSDDEFGRQVKSKLKMVDAFLERSQLKSRVLASGNNLLEAEMKHAKYKYGRASEYVLAKNYSAANLILNDTISDLRRVAKALTIENDERLFFGEKFIELRDSLYSLLDSHEHDFADKAGHVALAKKEINHAEELLSLGDVKRAYEYIHIAYQAFVKKLNTKYKDKTLVYDHNFDSPEEEFVYETKRYDSYRKLIDMMISNQQIQSQAEKLIATFVSKADKEKNQADRYASERDFDSALEMLEKAFSHAERALRLGGAPISNAISQ